MKFENSWVIAGVRGTSLAIQWDNITIYQSQQNTGGSVQLPRTDSPSFQIKNLSKCSSFNTRTKDTKPLPPEQTMNLYCLSGNNDTILDFTKKDLIYLNELIATNRAPDTVHAEKSITAPQEIQSDSIFCPRTTGSNSQKTTFWPDVTDLNEMCQEEDVVAIAKIPKGGLNGEFWYLDENKKIQKSPPIVFTHHNLNGKDGYTGKLELTDKIKQALSDAKIQKLSTDPFNGQQNNLMTIGLDKFQVNVAPDNDRYYLNKIITFSDGDENITFWPFTKEVIIKFVK